MTLMPKTYARKLLRLSAQSEGIVSKRLMVTSIRRSSSSFSIEGDTSTLILDACCRVSRILRLKTSWLNITSASATIGSALKVRHMPINSMLVRQETIVISMGTSPKSASSEILPKLRTLVTNASILLELVPLTALGLAPSTGTSELEPREIVCGSRS